MRGVQEAAEVALECLFLITLHTKMLPLVANAELSSGRMGMAVILDAASGAISRTATVVRAALLVLGAYISLTRFLNNIDFILLQSSKDLFFFSIVSPLSLNER